MQKNTRHITNVFHSSRARIMIFPYTYIFFDKTLLAKKLCDRNIESVSVRYKNGVSDFIGIPATKLRELRAIHVYVSLSEGTRRFIRVVALALSPIVFGSSAKTCSRSSRRELLLLPYFFFSHWFTIRNFVKRPRVADLRLVECSNSLFHPVAVYSISRAMRVSTIYIAVVRERSPWRYTHRSVARDRFRLSTSCVYVRCTYLDMCDGAKGERPIIDWL